MKKSVSIVIMAMLVCMASAFAITPVGFEAHKWVSVTGDWKWDGGWQMGNWETATYTMDAYAPTATSGWYAETEEAGTPWKYTLDSHVQFENAGIVNNGFAAWTVNDPATTPATGGYTKFRFEARNFGDFTTSRVVVSGFGQASVATTFIADTTAQQDAWVNVNTVPTI